jgi:hypothetical protein
MPSSPTRYRLTDGDHFYLSANYDARTGRNTPMSVRAPGMAYTFDTEREAVDWLAAAVRVDPAFSAFYPEVIK